MSEPAVRLDVWSDYVCPFCYLEEPTLARIKQEFGDAVQVEWRAFELRPEPVPTLDPQGDYLRDIWARAVYPMARERGMTLRLPPVQPRSRLAHEAAAFARAHGKVAELIHAIFQAFFENGEDIGNVSVLVALAGRLGIDEAGFRRALTEGSHREEVLADEKLGQKLRVSGVPAMAVRPAGDPVEQATMIDGAQPYAVLHKVIERMTRAQ